MPVSVTLDGVPAPHNPLEGAVGTLTPAAVPHDGGGIGQAELVYEHDAFDPPPEPLHVHVRVVPHDVAPLSPETEPVVHAPAVALHVPFTEQAAFVYEQAAFDPPPEPLQFQVRVVPHAVKPLSPDIVPVVHVPEDAPHVPLTTHAALVYVHDAFVPPLIPLQVQVRVVPHAVKPLSPETEPAVHAPAVAEQAPLTFLGAEQDAFVPPPEPLHVHVNGPEPVTALAVPVLQRLEDGAEYTATPFALPHEPLTIEADGQLNLKLPLPPMLLVAANV